MGASTSLGTAQSPRAAAASIATAALAACVSACSPGAEPITDCVPEGGARPVCGLHRPEDLDVVPGGRFLVLSQMGKFEDGAAGPGTLAFHDLSNGATSVAYPDTTDTTDTTAPAAEERWGDPSCRTPPDLFSPHGIHLAARQDGRLRLLVVNHGSRESVEMFEVETGDPAPTLAWRGCVLAPGLALNDVAALPDGGFVASHMWPPGNETWYGLLGMLGFSTGHVVEWHANAGLRQVPGTDAPMPNGVAVSADGSAVFVNAYMSGEVLRIDRTTGELLGRVEVEHPDNANWTADGTLLVASHEASVPAVIACNDIEEGACGVRFAIVAIRPETMRAEKIYENEGPPMGAGTSAVRVGDELVIGSFAGDRIVRVALTP